MILIYSEQVKIFSSSLHPDVKRGVKETIEGLAGDYHTGKPLCEDLIGFWRVAYKRYRIIYKPFSNEQKIEVYFIGHRETIYNEFSRLVKENKVQ